PTSISEQPSPDLTYLIKASNNPLENIFIPSLLIIEASSTINKVCSCVLSAKEKSIAKLTASFFLYIFLWRVKASLLAYEVITFAALPVGAKSTVRLLNLGKALTKAEIIEVLPVPA